MKSICSMVLRCVTGLVSMVSATSAFAQRIGDAPNTVLQALGTPSMERTTGDRQIRIYPEGVRIVFEGGKVVESNAAVAATVAQNDAVAAEKAEPEEAPKIVPRKVPQARVRPPKPAAMVETETTTKNEKESSGFGLLLVVAGVIICGISSILILVEAFGESVLWGAALLLLPISQLFFVATHWQQTKTAFLSSMLIGLPLMVVGSFI